MGHVSAALRLLSGKIKERSKVWIAWPAQCPQGTVEQVVRQCLARDCSITIISDLPLSAIVGKYLREIKVNSIFEWLAPSQEAAIVKASCDLAGNWFDIPAIDNLLMWRSVRLGEMLERILPTYSLIGAIRLFEGILSWVEKERPDVVILLEDRSQIAIAFRQVMAHERIPIFVTSSYKHLNYLARLKEKVRGELLWWLLDLGDTLVRGIWVKLRHEYFAHQTDKGDGTSPLAVFVGFAPNHYKHILPIAGNLRKKGWRPRVLRGLTGMTLWAAKGIEQQESAIDTVDGYVTAGIWSHYIVAKRQIRKVWQRLCEDGLFQGRFVYKGIDLFLAIRPNLRYCFYVYLPTAVRYLELTWKIIDDESPNVFVFGNDSCFRGHAMIAAARQRKIPTWVVQHGIPSEPWDYVPYSDKAVVWGENSRKLLVEHGANWGKLVCVGAPGLDALVLLSMDEALLAQRRADVCHKLGIDDIKGIVLLLTSPGPNNDNTSLTRMVCKVVKDLSLGDRFVIKAHPSEEEENEKKIAAEISICPIITKKVELWGIIAASKVVITALNSTAGVEALILRKPVIAVKTSEFFSIYANVPGLVLEIETEENLKGSLVSVLKGEFKPNWNALDHVIGPLDGKATDRAADLLMAMTKETHT